MSAAVHLLALCLALSRGALSCAGQGAFEDLRDDGTPMMSEPDVRRVVHGDISAAPCGPELSQHCVNGHCFVERPPDGPHRARCACLAGFEGERCERAMAAAPEEHRGASMAQEIRDAAASRSCVGPECAAAEKAPAATGGTEKESEDGEDDDDSSPNEGEFVTDFKVPADNIEMTPCPPSSMLKCQNGGSCSRVVIDDDVDIFCDCPPGFDGDLCERVAAPKGSDNSSEKKDTPAQAA